MSVELNDEQVELVLRLAEPIKGQQREQFMQALGRILAEGQEMITSSPRSP
jgi:hypothetical protein